MLRGQEQNRRPEKSRDLLAGGEHGRVRSNSAIRSPNFGLLGLVVLALIAAKALRQHKSRGIQ